MDSIVVDGSRILIRELVIEDAETAQDLSECRPEERAGIVRDAIRLGLAELDKQEEEWAPFWEYLKSPQGHEIASRVIALFEEIKKTTLDRGAEQSKLQAELAHRHGRNLLILQAIVFGIVVLSVTGLTYVSKFDPALGVLLGTLVGYFFGRR